MSWDTSNRRARLPVDWAALRKVVFARDGHICYICGAPGADTIDHVAPGDDHSPTNLRPVHDRARPHCHRRKSSQEGHTAVRDRARHPVEKHPGLR